MAALNKIKIKATIPFMRTSPSCLKHISKAPPNTITLDINISTQEFGGGNIQTKVSYPETPKFMSSSYAKYIHFICPLKSHLNIIHIRYG